MTALWIALTIGLPWLGALSVWLVGDRRPRAQHGLAVAAALLGALAAGGLALFGAPGVSHLAGPAVLGEVTFRVDALGLLLSLIAAGVGCLAVVFSVDYMHGERSLGRYYALVLAFIGAMSGLVLTDSLLLLFIFWELTALCSYALIAFHADDPRAAAGGLQALILTQVGGVGLLAGALLVYGFTGSYSLSGFLAQPQALAPTWLAVMAYGLLIAAMAKSAQVPLHSWLPNAMEAPTPVSALIHAATMVNAGVYLVARFYPAFAAVPGWTTAVISVGVLSALAAGLMALAADDLERVLASSTISQLGYLFYAVGTGALFAAPFHLLSHAVFKALLFLGAGAVIHAAGTRRLAALGGVRRAMPFTAAAFSLGALALAGVPVLNGFWSKELLLEHGLEHGPLWAYVAMLFGGGLTALYATRVVSLVFLGEARPGPALHEAGRFMRVALGGLALLTLTTWLGAGALGQQLARAGLLAGTHETTAQMAATVLGSPATYLALAGTATGCALWWFRRQLAALTARLHPLTEAAAHGFGFDALNMLIARLFHSAADALARTQTGSLNWNLVALAGALALGLLLALWRSG